jgi:hypothetical protein
MPLTPAKTTLSRKELSKLSLALNDASPRSRLFRLCKSHFSKLGYWKNKPRGNPEKGYEVSRERQEGIYNK